MVGSRWKFIRRFAEGIRKLAGNTKGDCRKKDRRTCRKIIGVYGTGIVGWRVFVEHFVGIVGWRVFVDGQRDA
ncbi:hypothetical protein B296_00054163 [Ensete ventricosum]|uniref:Uncharacterized protein n=1 Tax=Ensete ventricosum TaxID=4639 RepID=A0A426X2L8_ENSVE|nr:hypothetical protein B296_00054163 [Ensete ventricosum]